MYSPNQKKPNKPSASSSEGKMVQFLRFHLEPNTDLIMPVNQVLEVLTVPTGKIVPIPHMPAWVMGVYNWRGEILWMIDVGELMGLASSGSENKSSGSNLKALVLSPNAVSKTTGEMLGLVVNRVDDIELCNIDQVQSPPSSAISPELAPFLGGYLVNDRGEMLITIDGESIMAAMPKA